MSEKIYACLLRVFPSSFRKHYQEEALLLLRDRLRHERGFFRRLRLTFDLMADMIGALPQAYRNSYAAKSPAASLVSNFGETPSFRVLQKEPIRPVAITMAGLVALGALVTFPYVFDRTLPYHSTSQSDRISPIEAVIQRLNEVPPSKVAGASRDISSNPDASRMIPAETNQQEARPLSGFQPEHKPKAILLSATGAAAGTADQPVQAEQTPTTIPPGQRAAMPSPYTPNPIHPAAAADLSGRWTVSMESGTDADFPQWFNFQQDSASLTGIGGPNSTRQYRIVDGLVAGNSVKFELICGRRRFLYDLKIEDKQLRGTVSIRSANDIRTASVHLESAQ